jgi:hypothetical protein
VNRHPLTSPPAATPTQVSVVQARLSSHVDISLHPVIALQIGTVQLKPSISQRAFTGVCVMLPVCTSHASAVHATPSSVSGFAGYAHTLAVHVAVAAGWQASGLLVQSAGLMQSTHLFNDGLAPAKQLPFTPVVQPIAPTHSAQRPLVASQTGRAPAQTTVAPALPQPLHV